MVCLYCRKQIGLLRRITDPNFCSGDHRKKYNTRSARAIREAEFLRLDFGSEREREKDLTRTKLERRFLRVCTRYRLPKPEVNSLVGPYEVDFLWRDRKLAVETDGWGSHGGRSAFESDRARDVDLRLIGYDVVRFTWRQVSDHPAAVAAKLRALLTRE